MLPIREVWLARWKSDRCYLINFGFRPCRQDSDVADGMRRVALGDFQVVGLPTNEWMLRRILER